MPPCGLDVAAITAGQPFCAGVILMVDRRLLLTLDREHAPADGVIRVGGVGGGQEPGETIVQCALREAREELSVDVELVSAARTYIDYSSGSRNLRIARCTDEIRPFVFWSVPRRDPKPYAPGLPAGRMLYGAMYLARPRGELEPGDVEALLLAPPSGWPLVERMATIAEALEDGCRLLERVALPHALRLWTDDQETMRTVFELAAGDPELLAQLR
jgi:ADP-ribose pyrophosphatase YjhB (NUDIX family)